MCQTISNIYTNIIYLNLSIRLLSHDVCNVQSKAKITICSPCHQAPIPGVSGHVHNYTLWAIHRHQFSHDSSLGVPGFVMQQCY